MPDPSLEKRFATLVLNYCTFRRADADFALPDATVLPFVTAFPSVDRNKPCVAFHGEQVEAKANRRLIQIRVHVVVMVNHNDTPEDTEGPWVRSLRLILGDKRQWRTWLASIDESLRTGYRILKIGVHAGGTSFDPETMGRESTTTLTFHVFTDELERPDE